MGAGLLRISNRSTAGERDGIATLSFGASLYLLLDLGSAHNEDFRVCLLGFSSAASHEKVQGIFSCVFAWRIRSASSINWHSFLEEDPVRVSRISAALLPQRDTRTLVLAVGPNTQDRAGRLVAATGDHLEDVMVAYHSTWYCCRGCGHPVCLPTALEDTWWVFTPRDFSSVVISVGDADTLCDTG